MALPPEDQKHYLLRDLLHMRGVRVMHSPARPNSNGNMQFRHDSQPSASELKKDRSDRQPEAKTDDIPF